MKTGVFLFPENRDPTKDGAFIEETLQEARQAEDLGADAVFLAEHHFDGTCVYVDPPTFATALARDTKTIKIGFAVLQASLYHPLRLAEQLSLLDHLSGGRLIVGLGKGSNFNFHEYAAYEVPVDDARPRFEELEDILVKCWTQERVIHKGRFWNFDIPMLRPRPFTKPHPQLLRTAGSNESIIASARRGWPVLFPLSANTENRRMADLYAQTMSEAGFSDERVAATLGQCWIARNAIVTETDEEARDSGLSYVRQGRLYRAALSEKARALLIAAESSDIPPGVLCGSPATVLEQLEGLPETGVGGLILRFRAGPMPFAFSSRSLQLFMREVAPKMHRATSVPGDQTVLKV